MARLLFFRTSRSAYRQVSELFDFVWPTVVALWNLRWQVAGFDAAQNSATSEALRARFVAGSGVHGANLKRACIEMSWGEEQAQFAKFLLIDLFAIYEAWLSATLGVIGHSRREMEKDLQFPTKNTSGRAPEGISAALARLNADKSPMLYATFYTRLCTHSKNSRHHLEGLLICYRCFKECRNSIVHNGGIADQRAADAYTQYSALSPSTLPFHPTPTCAPVVKDSPVSLSLHGVVGFSDIILRLIATLAMRN